MQHCVDLTLIRWDCVDVRSCGCEIVWMEDLVWDWEWDYAGMRFCGCHCVWVWCGFEAVGVRLCGCGFMQDCEGMRCYGDEVVLRWDAHGITGDTTTLGGQSVLTFQTNSFNNILTTKQVPKSWHKAKIILLIKGDPKDVKNYRPTSLPSHSYKIFTRLTNKNWTTNKL